MTFFFQFSIPFYFLPKLTQVALFLLRFRFRISSSLRVFSSSSRSFNCIIWRSTSIGIVRPCCQRYSCQATIVAWWSCEFRRLVGVPCGTWDQNPWYDICYLICFTPALTLPALACMRGSKHFCLTNTHFCPCGLHFKSTNKRKTPWKRAYLNSFGNERLLFQNSLKLPWWKTPTHWHSEVLVSFQTVRSAHRSP